MDRKSHAEQILKNPLLEVIVTDYKQKVFEEWVSSQGAEEREILYKKMHSLIDFMNELKENLVNED